MQNATMKMYRQRYERLVTKLRQARLDAGLTQTQAGEMLGVDQTFISKCESGERRIDAIELQEFARIYRKPFSYFLK
jgi:transcriptional regulator with XRE-family HTH domain